MFQQFSMSNVVPGPSSPVFLGVPAPQSPAKRVPILLASSAACRSDLILESKKSHLFVKRVEPKKTQFLFSKGLWKKTKKNFSVFQREWNTSELTIDFQGSMWMFPKNRGTPKWMVYNGKLY